MDSRRKVELLEKHKPRQERAKRTYEGILAAAAELLVEVGVERISTNLIAERAGITVPALYRYFPNKYAVLHALGCALMDVQNEALERWFMNHMESGDPRAVISDVYTLFKLTYDVTLEQTGGLEIAQALRAGNFDQSLGHIDGEGSACRTVDGKRVFTIETEPLVREHR